MWLFTYLCLWSSFVDTSINIFFAIFHSTNTSSLFVLLDFWTIPSLGLLQIQLEQICIQAFSFMLARYLGMELLGDRAHACLISYEVSLPYHFTLQSPRCVGSLGILELVLYGKKENTCVVRLAILVSFCSSADWGLKGNPSFMLHSIVNLCQYHSIIWESWL